MFFQFQPIVLGSHAAKAWFYADRSPNGGGVAESPSQYRPRHPERSAFCQFFETHFDSYVGASRSRESRAAAGPELGPQRRGGRSNTAASGSWPLVRSATGSTALTLSASSYAARLALPFTHK